MLDYEGCKKELILRRKDPAILVEEALKEVTAALDKAKLKYQICGSHRRKVPALNDIDIVVKDDMQLFDAICLANHWKMGSYEKLSGNEYAEAGTIPVITTNGVKCDFLLTPNYAWGAAMLFLTGDRWFGECLKEQAKLRGWTLFPFGVFDDESGLILTEFSSEAGILELLGVPWVEPRDRETVINESI